MTTGCNRISVVGLPGAGKSTVSSALSTILDLQHIELDGIFWQQNWVPLKKEVMQERVDAACPADGRWVVDGNFSVTRPIVWGRAETLVWLDIPLWLSMWRLLKRTLARMYFKKKLWNDNQETWPNLFKWDWEYNIMLYAFSERGKLRAQVPIALREPQYRHIKLLRFRHPKEVEDWLRSLRLNTLEE